MIRSALVALAVALVYYDPAIPARGGDPGRTPRAWQLEWDDQDNYAAHPAVFAAAAAGLKLGDAPSSESLPRPVLGVWEPLAVGVKAATAYVLGATVHHARGEGPLLRSTATTPAIDVQQVINQKLPATVYAISVALLVVAALCLLDFTDTLVAEIAATIVGRKAKRGGERRDRVERQRVQHAVTKSLKTGSLAATLMWAVHPLRVEVVGWLSCQPYLLATICSLICLKARLARWRLWRADLSRRHRHRRKYPQGRPARAEREPGAQVGSRGRPPTMKERYKAASRWADQLRPLLLRLAAFVSFGLAVASKVSG